MWTWEAIAALVSVVGFVGLILFYAAKSIFRTKEEAHLAAKEFNAKLYDRQGITNFMPRADCNRHKDEMERRQDNAQRKTCDKLDVILVAQSELGREVAMITSRFDQYLNGEIRKEDKRVDMLADKIDGLITVLKAK